ncbi:hypothetical protein K443DRAFT_362846 [Laccaria amethystina LaAM-08-1]|uniref:Uncharacterized protein n=1 Tax=Laccaria amethystina LaAM-08-1 TaxID=1095629 RepID=A0A0C9WS17_9AGAR|nr:hypothetical protein K443DRAFT_362846 [Laccaria amethystina LaAM-08-1]
MFYYTLVSSSFLRNNNAFPIPILLFLHALPRLKPDQNQCLLPLHFVYGSLSRHPLCFEELLGKIRRKPDSCCEHKCQELLMKRMTGKPCLDMKGSHLHQDVI